MSNVSEVFDRIIVPNSQKEEVDFWNYVNEEAALQRDVAMSAAKADIERSNADFGDKTKAFIQNAQQSNNIYMAAKWLDKENVRDNEDEGWVENVSDLKNALSIAQINNLPNSSVPLIQATRNSDELSFIISKLQEDAEIERNINASLGMGGKIGSAVAGSLVGIETALAVGASPLAGVLTVGAKVLSAGAKAYKTASALKKSEDVAMYASMLNTRKRVLSTIGVGGSATVAAINMEVMPDYGKVDAMAEFVIGSALFRWDAGRQFAASMHKLDAIKTNIAQRDELIRASSVMDVTRPIVTASDKPLADAITEAKTLFPNQQTGLDDFIATQKASTSTSQLSKIKSTQKMLKQKENELLELIQNTNKTINDASGVLSKQKLDQLKQILNKANKELKKVHSVNTALKRHNNLQKNLSTKDKIIDKFFAKQPQMMKDEISEATKKVDEIANKILSSKSSSKQLDDFGKQTLKEHNGKAFAIKKNKDGTVEMGVKTKDGKWKSLTGKQKIATLGLIALASQGTLQAGGLDDDTDFFSYVPLAALGAFTFLLLRDTKIGQQLMTGEIKEAVKSIAGVTAHHTKRATSKDYYTADELYKTLPEIQERMGIISKTVDNRADVAGKELGKKLFWSLDNNIEETADYIKYTHTHTKMKSFYSVFDKEYDGYKKQRLSEQGASKYSGWVKDSAIRADFNRLVSDALTKKDMEGVNPFVAKAATHTRKIFDDLYDEAVEVGVDGFIKAKKLDEYIPRVVNNTVAFRALQVTGGLVESNPLFVGIRDNIAKAYSASHPKKSGAEAIKEANDYLEWISSSYNNNVRTLGDMMGDISARAKARMTLDFAKWEDVPYLIDGKEQLFKIEDLYERDIEKLITSYVDTVSGHIALGKKGITSHTEALSTAGKQTDPRAKEALTAGLNAILGKSNFEGQDKQFYQWMKTASNLATPMFLSLSSIMQIKEAGATALKSLRGFEDFKTSIREAKNAIFKNGETDDAYIDWLIDTTGTGAYMQSHRPSARMLDEASETFGDMGNTMSSKAMQSSRLVRDKFLKLYMIGQLTDWGQRMNSYFNAQYLAELVNGTKKMSKSQMTLNGISQKDMDLFKGKLTLNKNGRLTKTSQDAINNDKVLQQEFRRIIFNMGQRQTLTPMTGTSSYLTMTTSLGDVFGGITTFLFNSYSIYQSSMTKGMVKMDMIEFFDAGMWFASMYLAESIKNEIRGRNSTEEEIAMKAFMNMPHLGFASMVRLFTDPAAIGVTNEAKEMFEAGADTEAITAIIGGGKL